MTDPELNPPCQEYGVLVVAYDEASRAALAASPQAYGVLAIPCATFGEAEEHALSHRVKGILVDLVTMIKAKDGEKLIAHALTSIYPTLRVKSMGSMLIPMIMSGDAKQDNSLKEFFQKSCAEFTPRRLRNGRRRDICIPTFTCAERGFTCNISWSGLFIVSMNPERFRVDQEVVVTLMLGAEAGLDVAGAVVRIQSWGELRPPGIGVRFKEITPELEEALFNLLRIEKSHDRDRLGT